MCTVEMRAANAVIFLLLVSFSASFFFFYKYIVKLPIIQNDWTQTVRSNTLESCDPCSPILSLVFFAALLRALKKKKKAFIIAFVAI